MGIFNFWNTQTREEYVHELVHDAATSGGLKAVAVTALDKDGDLYTDHVVSGEGFVGQAVVDWTETLSTYTETHAAEISAWSRRLPK